MKLRSVMLGVVVTPVLVVGLAAQAGAGHAAPPGGLGNRHRDGDRVRFTFGATPPKTTDERCALHRNSHDLNGDGYDDAVIGDPYATVNGKAEAGAVVVLFGDADGRIGEGQRRLITQASVTGSFVEAGDHFGWSVAMNDATDNGCASILVGVPGEDWDSHVDAGVAQVISFTGDANGGPGSPRLFKFLTQEKLGGVLEDGDQFGYAVALGNAEDEDNPFAAIGAPGEDLGGVEDAGAVNVTGYVTNGEVHQGSTGAHPLPGTPQAGDRFGASVMISRLHPVALDSNANVQATDWVLAAGAPGDMVRSGSKLVDGAGSVSFWDDVVGFEQQVTQASPGVPGLAEAGDAFGTSIAFGETRSVDTGAIRLDVAVGAPGEDVGTVKDAGAATVLESTTQGIAGRRTFDQSTAGFAGIPEAGDHFGQSVAMQPRSLKSDVVLAIGVPDEDIRSATDAGLVQTVLLADDEADMKPVRAYSEDSPGTPGRVTTGSRFGLAVAGMQGVHETMLTMSSPLQGAGSVFVVRAGGATRSWVPGRGGVPTTASGRFGWSLSGLQTS